MRCLNRNKVLFHYARYLSKQPVYEVDEYGNRLETDEYQTFYENPVPCKANISPASGATATELFGSIEGYDKIIMVDNPQCPIDEHSILWIDTSPEVKVDSNTNVVLAITTGGVIIGDNGQFSPYDYIVKRVARSLNNTAIAISKVNVQ